MSCLPSHSTNVMIKLEGDLGGFHVRRGWPRQRDKHDRQTERRGGGEIKKRQRQRGQKRETGKVVCLSQGNSRKESISGWRSFKRVLCPWADQGIAWVHSARWQRLASIMPGSLKPLCWALCCARDCTQGFLHARLALCQISYIPTAFSRF